MCLSPSIEPFLLIREGPFTQLAKEKKAWVIHSLAGLATREETVRSRNFPKEKFWHQLPTHRIGWPTRTTTQEWGCVLSPSPGLLLACRCSSSLTWPLFRPTCSELPVSYLPFQSSTCLSLLQLMFLCSLPFSASALLTFNVGNGHFLRSWNFQITF